MPSLKAIVILVANYPFITWYIDARGWIVQRQIESRICHKVAYGALSLGLPGFSHVEKVAVVLMIGSN